ncbi:MULTISPECIES: DivIVA domain-containing protein [Nocardiopsis]|uniref:Cell wall synthesis protein Wag31 n=1 Tax=Nocardiopsis sinuspersici TaxID=501010 RepID=A0A1V3C4U5_9ACTN|nr:MULTISPECIES: DivIVA domain-containing protein [Nocardiopsis]OOC55824.1 cell division protein DivIVA [Nocardiopsis sinuspersici]
MGTMPLTPADIREKKFHTVRLRPGYNEEDVDELLDRIEATLIALEGGPRTGPLITADEVRNARFRTTRLSPGYHEDEVDDFLDTVVADLAGRGLGRSNGQQQPPPPPGPVGGRGRPGGPGVPGTPSRTQGHPPDEPRQRHGTGPSDRPPRPPRGFGMTPEDIREQQFATTRLTTGYNEQEVDDFLDRAEFTLGVLQRGQPERATLTAAEVERVQFATTRARPGYDPAQVDRFLDVLAEEMRQYERPG